MSSAAGGRPSSARGQATVEVVLVLPVVIGLVLAVVQIGLVARDQLLLIHAAREAARAAAVDPTPDGASSAARAAGGLRPDRLGVDLGPVGGPGQRLVVTVRYAAPTEVPLVGLLVPDIPLRSDVTVRIE